MKTRIQATLLIAAALYMGWGVGLLLAPGMSQSMISVGPPDSSTTAMLGAALLGLMVTFLFAAYDPEKEIVRDSATGMAFVGFTAAYLMFSTKSMPLSAATFISLVIDLGAAGLLFLSETGLNLKRRTAGARGKRRRAATRR